LVLAAPAHAQEPTERYTDLVARYAAGDRAAAVTGIGDGTLQAALDQVRRMADRARRCRECPERAILGRLPLRAAIMLHTDRDAFEREERGDEQLASCGIGDHGAAAEALVLVLLADDTGREFARRWYRAVAQDRLTAFCFDDARRWTETGLKWFASDPELLLILGTLGEIIAHQMGVRPGAAPPRVDLQGTPRRLRESLADAAERRQYVARAQQYLEDALAASPDLTEARLRLGRVAWRQGRPDAARNSLEAVIAGTRDPALLSLAHLFLGQVHEDAGRLDEAEVQYRMALVIEPHSQAAAVALSHVLQLTGDPSAARSVLRAAVERAGSRTEADPYWTYHAPSPSVAERLLHELRRESRR
jgi:tetratricopeptide (TPR) repeat protein